MTKLKYDFSGYATKNNLKCSDGRTIQKDAFKHNDGQTVPLVWQHLHNEPANILGHAVLENREEGVYTYGVFNDSEAGKTAKELVKHGDITKLSIYANSLKQAGDSVLHGVIREVSLVLSGANPGAFIDNLNFSHSDGTISQADDEAVIYTGLSFELSHSEEENRPAENVEVVHADGEKTIEDVFNTMNEEQKNLVYFMVGEALTDDEPDDAEHSDDDPDDITHSTEGGKEMKTNVFDSKEVGNDRTTLTHDQLATIITDAKKCGSFKEAFLAHAVTYGIENIDYLFPDARTIQNSPEFISRRMAWVSGIIGGAKHSPFSRIKSMTADITLETARAKGYIKGNEKKEEFFALAKRTTGPTTVYKKQKLDRDDIIDITDLDVVAWLKAEMRVMLDEEIARAALIGDGRDIESEDKIDETCIRPIAWDAELYSHPVTIPANVSGEAIIEAIIRARTAYKGSGTPTFYTTDGLIIDLLLLKDKMGRRLFRTEQDLAAELRVASIVAVEPMETITDLLGIIVNMSDYTMGADKGGQVSMFDDFDIDYNQFKYLIEGRMSGCLTKPKSALIIKRASGTLVTPTVPTFVPATGVITIPTKTGVAYFIDDVSVSAGAQTALASGVTAEITAAPTTGYYFPHNTDDDWTVIADVR